MSLKGNLETFFLINVMQLLCNEQKTGILQVTDGNNEVKVIINEGTIMYAMGTQKEFRLGSFLKNEGLISEELLQKSLEEGKEKQMALGKIMVENGYISQKELKEATGKQVKELLYSMFLWEKGNFEYKDATLNLKGMIVVPLNTMNLILEASRRIDEMSVLKKQIPEDEMKFKLSEKILNKEDVILNLNEWYILSIIDSNRTVRQVIEKSGYDEYRVYKILFSLISYGLIEETKEIYFKKNKYFTNYSILIKFFHDIVKDLQSE